MVLGSRKAESATRRAVLEEYEKKRYRAHLSPNGSFSNSYVFTPIENWSNDNVWQYLVQFPNPWGHSNKDLLAMYSGASSDGECPLVIDTSTPSCGNMYFTKIELHNFGIYNGTHEMCLSDEVGTRNITLVGGLNGRGKTTFHDAVLLALYGKQALQYIQEKSRSYDRLLFE